MTAKELIERLDDEEPDAEVRFVYQATYPLQDDIKGVWAATVEATCPNGGEHELQEHYELGQRVEGKRWCVDCQLVYEDDELEQLCDPSAEGLLGPISRTCTMVWSRRQESNP